MVHRDRPVRKPGYRGKALPYPSALALIFALAGRDALAGADRFDFDLPAQPLATALNSVADTSGIKLMYADAAVQGLTTRTVRGHMTPDEALKRLLARNGLRHEWVDKTLVAVKEDPQTAKNASFILDLVSVTGSAEDENPGYAAIRTSTATKTDTPIMETPVSIQTVTRQVMED